MISTLSRVVVFPEDFEKLGEADLFWRENNSHHLGVPRPACNTQLLSAKQTTERYSFCFLFKNGLSDHTFNNMLW